MNDEIAERIRAILADPMLDEAMMLDAVNAIVNPAPGFDAAEGAFLVIRSDLRLDGSSTLSLHRNGDDVHLRIQHDDDEEYAVAVLPPRDQIRLAVALRGERVASAAAADSSRSCGSRLGVRRSV